MKKESENMEFTGERFVPGVHGNIELEHLHRYLQACEIAAGKVVLDIASGEGYGSAMLADKADKVIGVDISVEAVKHARKRYKKENLEYMAGSCADIPLPDASVDLVVSFETIEHHDQHEEMMREVKRVLRPIGVILLSSPDKYHYSVEPGYSNPYHIKELYQHEFKQLLGKYFKNIAYFGQRIIYGSGMFAECSASPTLCYWQENELIKEAPGIVKPIYWIAVASDARLPKLSSGVLEQPINDSEIIQSWTAVVADRERQMANFSDALETRDGEFASLNQVLAEREGQIGLLNQAISERDGQIVVFNQTVAEHEQEISTLNKSVSERDEQILGLNETVFEREQEIFALKKSVSERDEQILGLNETVSAREQEIFALKKSVSERDEQILGLKEAVSEREQEISTLNKSVSERDEQILGLKEAVSEREQEIFALKKSVSGRDQQIVGLNQAITKRDGQIANLNQAVSERDGHIVELKQSIRDRENVIAALHGSNSWRITKPLRWVSHLLNGKENDQRTLEKGEKVHSATLVEAPPRELSPVIGLPNDFDREMYLKLNPDLAKAAVDPVNHYLAHGRYEGRSFSLPALEFRGEENINDDRETILVVSHEASRTGAPILSLNLVQELVERYNVVVLLMGGGPLSDAFRLAGAAVMNSSKLRGSPVMADLIVGQVCERFNFKFALVNSIESRVVLPALSNHFVPAISLIHEFASCYTLPQEVFREAFFWSDEIVFSSNVTLANALEKCPYLGDRSAPVLPQGRSLIPSEAISEDQLREEKERIRRLIRPGAIAQNSVIILGAGTVQFRKGADLFIECAARVISVPEGSNCRFVWIGQGYDPDNDAGYSVYLADQIRRAGLEGHVFFVGETAAIDVAYEEADLFLLSSRLDPLPNVAIDAMEHGVPVLCFNKTTGIADFLIDNGLENDCVAKYLDSADIAEKILALASSQDLRAQVATRCREASIKYFNMKEYVAQLEVLAQAACNRVKQEMADTQVILDSGLFRRDFSCTPYRQSLSLETDIRAYVREWASGIGLRKPLPGFHPGIYLEQQGLATSGADPFAEYLRAGRPDGSWNYPLILAEETSEKDLPANQRIALHLHVYFPELLAEITSRLLINRIRPDLFVSITNEAARKFVVDELKDYRGKIADIQLVPNRGRDLGPFFTTFGHQLMSDYDFVGHIHTKKSADVKAAVIGKSWNRFLLENLLGGESGPMADSILAKLKIDTSIGMVFPDDPYIVGWGASRAIAESLAGRLGIEKLPEHFIFPVGTMFWARTSALKSLIDLKLNWDDYPEEPLPYDGTILHALERMLTLCHSFGAYHSAVTNVKGVTR